MRDFCNKVHMMNDLCHVTPAPSDNCSSVSLLAGPHSGVEVHLSVSGFT